MDKIYTSFLYSFIFLSCNEEEPDNVVDEIRITIANSETYVYDFMIFGDEEGATIKAQAHHFLISEIIRDATTNWRVVYQYKPHADFVGKDFVEIQTCTGGQGTGCTDHEIVRISFTVTH